MYAIKKIKNEYGVYELHRNYDDIFVIDPLDFETIATDPITFDSNIYFCFDPNITLLPNCQEQDFKSINDRKIVEITYYEKINPIFSDFKIINDNWKEIYFDYKQARSDMKLKLVASGGFNNLLLDNKKIVSSWFIVPKTDRDSVYSTLEQIKLGEVYHYYSKLARQLRLSKVLMFFYNILTNEQINQVLTLISTLATNYVDFGIEGTLEGNVEGLFDFIEARLNTSYQTNGVKTIANTDIVMDILRNGIF